MNAPHAMSRKAVPNRHYGQWIAALVIVGVVALLVRSIAANDAIQWSKIGSRLFLPSIIGGLYTTILLTVASMVLGVVGGIVVAVMRLSNNVVLSRLASAYIWLFRGTPILVQILIWFNLALFFPTLGFGFLSVDTNSVITPFGAALLGLALNEAAYMSEIVRGGILAVDAGQKEAAQALGMSEGRTMKRIVLPQAMRVIIPPTGNELITVLKTTSLVAVIGAGDLLTKAQAVGAVDFTKMEMLIVASIWYLLLTTLASIGQARLEKHYGRSLNRDGSRGSMSRLTGLRRLSPRTGTLTPALESAT